MFHQYTGGIICMCCLLEEAEKSGFPKSVVFGTRTEALEHLQKHRDKNHIVPEEAFVRLKKEIEDEGDDVSEPDPSCIDEILDALEEDDE